MEKFYFESVEDILRLVDEPLPQDGLYCNIRNKNDHFYIIYEGYTPIFFVDLSKVTTMGVTKMWAAQHDEDMPSIDSSFMVAVQVTHEYDIEKIIEVAIVCQSDGRLFSMNMREEDAHALGISEIEREKDEWTED